MSLQQPIRSTRYDTPLNMSRFRGGKIVPVNFVPFYLNEMGRVISDISIALDPLQGELRSPIQFQAYQIFVPREAMHKMKYPTNPNAGITDVIELEMATGNPVFVLEAENAISKKARVVPRSIGGVLQVSEEVRLAYNCAVNFLRLQKYSEAELLLASNNAIVPAIVTSSVLERFGGVLNPDPRINGSVALKIPTIKLPVFSNSATTVTGGVSPLGAAGSTSGTAGNIAWSMLNGIWATSSGLSTSSVSLTDFDNAEKQDEMIRVMRKIISDNPEYGHDIIRQWAHGLEIDTGNVPYILSQRSGFFGRGYQRPTDTTGLLDDVTVTEAGVQATLSSLVPRTSLGGMVVTLVMVKPDEVISDQPHPFLTKPFGMHNYLADELALDPEKVNFRDLDAACGATKENTLAFYVGNNDMMFKYSAYGFARDLLPSAISQRNVVWQYQLPLSVTPQNINYPEILDHGPFVDTLAEVCHCIADTKAVIQTAFKRGPSPVENLQIVDQADLFDLV